MRMMGNLLAIDQPSLQYYSPHTALGDITDLSKCSAAVKPDAGSLALFVFAEPQPSFPSATDSVKFLNSRLTGLQNFLARRP